MKHGAPQSDLSGWEVGVLAVGLFEDDWGNNPILESFDSAFDGRLRSVLEAEEFKAKAGTSKVIHTLKTEGPQRLLFFGLGKRDNAALSGLRDFVHGAVSTAGGAKCSHLGISVPEISGVSSEILGSQAMMAAELGRYGFDKYQKDAKPSTVEEISWHGLSAASVEKVADAQAVAAGVARTRDLVNEPPGICNPDLILEHAQEIAKLHGLDIKVRNREQLQAAGYGCLVGVSLGSDEEAYLIELTYKPAGTPRSTVALVGKGITFDSGGYDLKPAQFMLDMKTDMAGAATVLGTMDAIGAIKPDVEVRAYVPTCENLVNGKAFKPGDVLSSYSGKTVEIGNTDAEGRLILSDSITYASERKPDFMIDLATLTGACVVALGEHTAGLFSPSEKIAAQLLESAAEMDESIWRMPMQKKLRKQLDSKIADIKNVGKRYGGAITAALFLKEFVGEGIDWAHIDIAGPAYSDAAGGSTPFGGTGYGVATLVRFLQAHANPEG